MRAWKLIILCGAFLILPLAGLAAAAGAGQGTDDTGGKYTPTSAACATTVCTLGQYPSDWARKIGARGQPVPNAPGAWGCALRRRLSGLRSEPIDEWFAFRRQLDGLGGGAGWHWHTKCHDRDDGCDKSFVDHAGAPHHAAVTLTDSTTLRM